MAIAERSALSTDVPLRAERYPSGSLCQVFDPAKAGLTDAFLKAASPQWYHPAQSTLLRATLLRMRNLVLLLNTKMQKNSTIVRINILYDNSADMLEP